MSTSGSFAAFSQATRALGVGTSAPIIGAEGEDRSQPIPNRSPAIHLSAVNKTDLDRDDLTGFCLNQYRLGEKIGGGGMGKVFLAWHTHLNRQFAVKFMAGNLSEIAEAQQRFEREIRALGRLQHPHIVNAVDAGCMNGLQFLVTEHVDGEDLAQFMQRRKRVTPDQACEMIRQAALGLAHSHAAGFIHRDIKPSNLIVDREGTVKILDFGLVRHLQRDLRLTDNGDQLGTWDFLAPEQAHDSSQVDHRCDIYSLGCTLIYLLSGKLPFEHPRYATPAAKLKGHLFDIPNWLQCPPAEISKDLLSLLNRMVAKSPSQRIGTASEVASALEPFTGQASIPQDRDQLASTTRGLGLMRKTIRRITVPLCALGTCIWFAYSDLDFPIQIARPDNLSLGTTLPESISRSTHVAVQSLNSGSSQPNSNAPLPVVQSTEKQLRLTMEARQTNSALPLTFPLTSNPERTFQRQWDASSGSGPIQFQPANKNR